MRFLLRNRTWLTACALPAWLIGLLAVPPELRAQNPAATTTPIQHVVVIFQENVSFDHYFATYPVAANSNPSEPLFTAAPGTPPVNGLNGPLLTNNPNSAPPFRLSRAQAVTCDQDHGYSDEQKAFDNGLMNRFVEAVGYSDPSCDVGGYGSKIVMGYYDGNTVTAVWNYAQNYAMSDNSFGTTFGPSTPGALNLIAGQTHGATVASGSAGGNVSSGSVIGDPRPAASLDDCTVPNKTQITMSGRNVGDLLNAKNVTWGWFQGGFKPTSRMSDGTAVCSATHNNISGASAGTDYIPHHEPFQYYTQTANPHHLPPTSTAMIGRTDQANHQYDLSDFFNALNGGNLPAVSYLKAAAYQDGHAGYSDPLDEQTFLVNTINAIMQSPYWSSTAIIISYDDSDGWYDHVIGPIVTQSTTPDDNLSGPGACGSGSGAAYQGRCGYGPRLPLMVISPYSKVNYVDHNVTDQSSILRFIEDNWNLGRLGDSSTDAIAGSLLSMFNFQAGPTAKAVLLDPTTGKVTGTASSGGGASAVTKAVANPKALTVTVKQVQLDGSGSTSFDGKPLTYQWSVAAGGPAAIIYNASTATPTVQFNNGSANYTFVLTVTDDAGQTSTDTAVVTYFGPY
ncbi:MAG TPA: alkaline phosphatase family protein [Bryobacteraceae bacterium]|nr:alkaline phosphatase family protein [Bryobacteraceae bacterium]